MRSGTSELAGVRALDLRRAGAELESCVLGLTLGFLLLPLMLLPLAQLGALLEPSDPLPLAARGAVSLVAVLVVPASEELLFRRLLLPALAERFGPAAGLLAVTALYAACHAGPGTLWVAAATGALFGLVMLASGSLALCIGLHAGLDLAVLAGGLALSRVA
jgi:membrane protease YdiL (CAAX protease family)